jgi:hypothetical protein
MYSNPTRPDPTRADFCCPSRRTLHTMSGFLGDLSESQTAGLASVRGDRDGVLGQAVCADPEARRRHSSRRRWRMCSIRSVMRTDTCSAFCARASGTCPRPRPCSATRSRSAPSGSSTRSSRITSRRRCGPAPAHRPLLGANLCRGAAPALGRLLFVGLPDRQGQHGPCG